MVIGAGWYKTICMVRYSVIQIIRPAGIHHLKKFDSSFNMGFMLPFVTILALEDILHSIQVVISLEKCFISESLLTLLLWFRKGPQEDFETYKSY
jgi:hypothetical protein